MVTLHEDSIVVTLVTPSPAETLAEIQKGIIEMTKTILASGDGTQDLNLDRPTAEGCYFVLELLQAMLFDPATVDAAQALATTIQERGQSK